MAENEVAVSFSQQLTDKVEFVTDALPQGFNKTRFVQNCTAVLNSNKDLMKINKNMLIEGLMKGAYLGLDFMNKECYLIPYGNTVQFQTDYKGEIKFVKRYSIRKIQDIYAKVVREGDEFSETILGGKPSIDFKPIPFNGNEIVGAFAVVLYEDGGMDYEVMSIKDIHNVRNNYSKAAQSKAWKYSLDEMAKKTVLRRLCKHIETDFDTVEARQAWDDGAGMEFTSTVNAPKEDKIVNAFGGEPIDTTAEEIEDISSEPMPEVFA